MKTIAALAVAICIAAVGVSWFMSNPVVVGAKVEPLKARPDMPTFHRVKRDQE